MSVPVFALQPVLDHLPVAAYLCDAAGLITYFNARAADLWGRAPALNDPTVRWTGAFRLYQLDGTPLQPDQTWLARAIAENHNHVGAEVVIERPDGTRVHALAHATPLHDDHGRVTGGVNVLIDVGEHIAGEEARSKLAAIVETSHDAIVSKTLDGVVTSWNRAAERLFGYDAQDVIGRSITLVIPPERHREEAMILERLRRGERIDSYETQRVRQDGTLIDVSLTISPLRDSLGRIIGASKIARDIGARKLADRKLRDSEQRFRSLVEASGAIVFDADGGMGWHARNRDWEGYTGQSRDAYTGHGWLEMIHPEDRAAASALVGDSIKRGETFHTDVRLWHAPTASWRHQELRVVPIRAQHAHVQAWVGTWLDVDARHKAQDALRTADRRKDEFLAIMAHELRNPLAPLANALELLQAGDVGTELRRELLDVASRQTGLLIRLVDDLMEASRIGRGVIELRRERVLLGEVIDDAIEISQPLLRERRQQLTVHRGSTKLQVLGDRTRLTQVVANLLNNAAKYTHEGGHVEIHAGREGNDGVISVADDGTGIPRDMLSRIFELFTQVDRSPERTLGGLGIGLSLVERLVRLHGGTVEAHSDGQGRGSEFVVRLPLLAEKDIEAADDPAPRRRAVRSEGDGRRSASPSP